MYYICRPKKISMEKRLKGYISEALRSVYNCEPDPEIIQIQETRREFTGDFTVVVFPFTRFSRTTPELTGEALGSFLKSNYQEVADFNVIKGFLNIVLSESFWKETFAIIAGSDKWGFKKAEAGAPVILVEYSSPNTNKPLHLGHIRNNLLGFSLYRILVANGNNVIKTNIVNDRGIHICKSMVAWIRYGKGETPESSGLKGDHLVGKYYVLFDREYKSEIEVLVRNGMQPDVAKENAPLMQEAREMLRKWEAGDKEVISLWKAMNSWVYDGFDITYSRLGVDFDKIYYESETYLKGKEIVEQTLTTNVLYKKDDGSVWADLTDSGLDHKLLLRADGTAVYMTQDLGTAIIRQEDYRFDQSIYVVGNEQNYHFQVLTALLKKMGYAWADGLHHFSYGMVELPEGKMKSREGTVVDADDLIDEMISTARTMSEELGKLDNLTAGEREEVFRKVGMGALKYFILKVDPRKNMTFNPVDSIDFNGNTGPFIQYTYARIRSVLSKAEDNGLPAVKINGLDIQPNEKETNLLRLLRKYPGIVSDAGNQMSPSIIANYVYELAREYNQFYHEYSILNENDLLKRDFRIILSDEVAGVILSSMWLLGIDMPERM
jgi:arginyl-tRNA synthetase